MQRTYYVPDSRNLERKVVRCSAAWIAVEQRDQLIWQSWKVVVRDANGERVSDEDLVDLSSDGGANHLEDHRSILIAFK
jgi:hypothetical protein